MKNKKILILQNVILHYRKALYNELSKKYDVTILHSGKPTVTSNDNYKEIIVRNVKVGPFFIQSNIYKEIDSKKYDAVISMFDLRWINNILTFLIYRKHIKYIWWGAWFTKSKLANSVRLLLTNLAESNILYTESAKKEFIKKGVNEDKLFVANNTFDVGLRIKSFENEIKNTIIFIGSLDKRKQIDILINAYSNIKDKLSNNIKLLIVGDGKEREKLEIQVSELKLNNYVLFLGKVNDLNKLHDIYKTAIVSASFGQAGLSVLQSFGFGVPFITKENAISGGEKTNIIHGENGFFCEDNCESLEIYLIRMINDIEYARKLGKFAFDYYTNYCTIENMAKGIEDAIEA